MIVVRVVDDWASCLSLGELIDGAFAVLEVGGEVESGSIFHCLLRRIQTRIPTHFVVDRQLAQSLQYLERLSKVFASLAALSLHKDWILPCILCIAICENHFCVSSYCNIPTNISLDI